MNDELLPARMPQSGALAVNDSEPQDIVRFAMERGAGVDVIERMMVVRRELRAEKAKEQYDAAMKRFQAQCPIIKKGKAVIDKNGKLRYRFAPLDQIVFQVKDLLSECGFSYKIDSPTVGDGTKAVKAVCTVKHDGGHSEVNEFQAPIDPEGYMTLPQRAGAALTFATRYAFRSAFGILTTDEDYDCVAQPPNRGFNATQAERAAPATPAAAAAPTPAPSPAKPQTSAAKKRLWEVSEEIRGAEKSWDVAIAWMIYKKILNEGAKISDLTDEEMIIAAEKVEIELQN